METMVYRSKDVRRTHEKGGKLKRDVHGKTNAKREGGERTEPTVVPPRLTAKTMSTQTTSGVGAILLNMAQLVAAITLH